MLGALQRRARSGAEASNSGYLQDRVKYDDDKLLDAESNGVMMEWERPLMESHAQVRSFCSSFEQLRICRELFQLNQCVRCFSFFLLWQGPPE